MMMVNVNIQVDFTFGFLSHFLWVPPVVMPVPTPTFSIEIPATQMWTLGFACNQNKFTNKSKPVQHKGQWIVIDGHDTGMMIPDVTVPFVNMQYPLMWPFSSRKIMFSASTVQMCGTAVACAQLVGLPPIPQMSCGDPVSAPVDWSAITITNTLSVGMSLKDLLIGAMACALSMAIDFAMYKLFPPSATNSLKDGIVGGVLGKLVPGMDKGETTKRVLGALADFAVSAAKGDPSFKISLFGGPIGGIEVEVKPPAAGSNDSWVTGRANVGGHQWVTQGSSSNWGTPSD